MGFINRALSVRGYVEMAGRKELPSHIVRPQITFGFAAKAAGISEATLRNWLDRGQVWLEGDDEREEGAWRRFALVDVVRLAIVGRLVGYGLTVEQAAEYASDAFDGLFRYLCDDRRTNRFTLPHSLRGYAMALIRNGEQITIRLGHPKSEIDTADLRHYVMICADKIAEDVLKGLREAA